MHVSANPFAGLTYLTEESPPYNYLENNQLQGLSVELLLKASDYYLSRKDISLQPWPRAYKATLKGPNTVLFSVTRTAAREHLFKWVGPIRTSKIVVLVAKDNPVNSLAELINQGGEIGVIRNDAGEILLKGLNIKDTAIKRLANTVSIAKMLARKRIQGWAYDEEVALWKLKSIGEQVSDYRALTTLDASKIYYAVSTDVDNQRIQQLNEAVRKARASQ